MTLAAQASALRRTHNPNTAPALCAFGKGRAKAAWESSPEGVRKDHVKSKDHARGNAKSKGEPDDQTSSESEADAMLVTLAQNNAAGSVAEAGAEPPAEGGT